MNRGWFVSLARRGFRPPGWAFGRVHQQLPYMMCAGCGIGVAAVVVDATIRLTVDGEERTAIVDTRVTLLDLLREHLAVVAPKKGCDHGQCGSCTVLLDGRRVTTCLAFAVQHDGAEITTAAGVGTADAPHPVQRAFLDHDGFQCGYCTPGQICSAVGMLAELEAGWPSHVTRDVASAPGRTPEEIRERMSGNLCRCGAYVNIVAAIEQAAGR